MILCNYCSWESYQEKEYQEASKTWTICSGCKVFTRCGWWEEVKVEGEKEY